MPEANEKEAIIATQHREFLRYLQFHLTSQTIITIRHHHHFKTTTTTQFIQIQPAFIYYTRRLATATNDMGYFTKHWVPTLPSRSTHVLLLLLFFIFHSG